MLEGFQSELGEGRLSMLLMSSLIVDLQSTVVMEMVASGATSARQMQQFIEANLHHRQGKEFQFHSAIGCQSHVEWQQRRAFPSFHLHWNLLIAVV